MIPPYLVRLLYLAAAVLFVIGLRQLQHPDTARRGNQISAVGMLLAILVTLFERGIISYTTIVAGMAIGSAVGFYMARTVQMTSMPQMVALLNGIGGGASMLVAIVEFLNAGNGGSHMTTGISLTTQLGIVTGAVTFTGSLVAVGKLQEFISGRAVTFAGQRLFNGTLFVATAALVVWLAINTAAPREVFLTLVGLSMLLGIVIVLPIGGADMPVVVALLNSCSGIAAAMTGFVINNDVLIVAGAIIGSSGFILTQIMCRAMNRSLANVMFGAFGSVKQSTASGSSATATVNPISVEDAAVQLAYAQSVIVIPGYGLAVAQAQHQVRELADLIEKKGGSVKYAIHPVAGRMPGHMNVLLAESNIPYDKLFDMDDINSEFERTDIALVIGANDVVNPAARTDTSSPIYGMPILDADRARRIIVLKRGMNAGFAGIENDLFCNDKTQMLFGDAKNSLTRLVSEVKQL